MVKQNIYEREGSEGCFIFVSWFKEAFDFFLSSMDQERERQLMNLEIVVKGTVISWLVVQSWFLPLCKCFFLKEQLYLVVTFGMD